MIRDVLTLSQLRALPADEAAALFSLRLADGGYPHERELFAEWIGLSPSNRDAWDHAQRAWNIFDGAMNDELLAEMRSHARSKGSSPRHNWHGFAAAAALALVVASGSIIADRAGVFERSPREASGPAQRPPLAEASYSYASGRELPKLITLPDGSRMTLDAQSRVEASFTPGARKLEVLSGRAFFDVRHDASKPFQVRARNVEVMDIGTRFDVRLADNGVRVLLVEGRLSVTSAGKTRPVLMSPGDLMVARTGTQPIITRTEASDDALNWQKGLATFDNDTLSSAAAALNRYPGDRLVVRDPRVAELRISGTFRMGNAERFGETLEQIYPVRVIRRSTGEIEIVPAG